jgi:8-oxo-dGTP diphosphatase
MPLFNVRVYGLLFDEQKRLLVSDEFIRGNYFTKLPGGGLEFGEGTRDCLQREFMEDQIISIYYSVKAKEPILLETKIKAFDFAAHQTADPNGESEVFRWIEWNDLNENDMSLPIDKVVIRLLKQ